MDRLEQILSGLSHLNLRGQIVDKKAHASGYGGSCDVYTAWSTKHNKKVAVKQFRIFMTRDKAFAKRLVKEIRIWSALDHEYVLPLLGFITEGEYMVPSLISEWMENGTLHDYMKTFGRCTIETCTMLFGIASGLSYLHSKAVIHADLKSHNILISANKTPLLADFGVSLMLSQTQPATGTASSTGGTVRWMAKELFVPSDSDSPKYDEMTDVWAFGMVVYELISWNLPYNDKRADHMVIAAIMQGQLPKKPGEIGEPRIFSGLWDFCNRCWAGRNSRPSAAESVAILELLTDVTGTRSSTAYDNQTATETYKDIITSYDALTSAKGGRSSSGGHASVDDPYGRSSNALRPFANAHSLSRYGNGDDSHDYNYPMSSHSTPHNSYDAMLPEYYGGSGTRHRGKTMPVVPQHAFQSLHGHSYTYQSMDIDNRSRSRHSSGSRGSYQSMDIDDRSHRGHSSASSYQSMDVDGQSASSSPFRIPVHNLHASSLSYYPGMRRVSQSPSPMLAIPGGGGPSRTIAPYDSGVSAAFPAMYPDRASQEDRLQDSLPWTTRSRNPEPCGYCQEHRIRCEIGYPWSKSLCKKCSEMKFSHCPPPRKHEPRF